MSAAAAEARARAALERERAAAERIEAVRERTRWRRSSVSPTSISSPGRTAARWASWPSTTRSTGARRSDGRFILAFLDVDGLKAINDRDGHAAGDPCVQTVAQTIRTRLRSFDPFVRYGGDEFLCGLGGMDLTDANVRFLAIERAIQDAAKVGVSVGLAGLTAGDTVSILTQRADAAMLQVKAQRHMRA